MNRKMLLQVAVSCFALALAACGGPEEPRAEVTEAAAPIAEVEQGIGDTPLCPSSSTVEGFIQGKTEWAAACGTCAQYAGGGFGLPGNYYERCCQRPRYEGGTTTCGSWKLIKPVCSACGPL